VSASAIHHIPFTTTPARQRLIETAAVFNFKMMRKKKIKTKTVLAGAQYLFFYDTTY